MANKTEKLYNWGLTLSSLGGLLVILNLIWDNTKWESAQYWLAVILVFLGIYLVDKAKRSKDRN